MMNHNVHKNNLSFENNETTLKSLEIIRKEFVRNSIKVYLSLICITGAYLIYFILVYSNTFSFPPKPLHDLFIIDHITAWSFFIIYLLFHFFILSLIQFSPSLINYLKYEIKALDLKLKRRYMFNSKIFLYKMFSILLFITLDLILIYLENLIIKIFVIRFLIFYIFISIAYPIIKGLMHDKFIIKLKKGYYIQFQLQFRIIKPKGLEPQSIKIFLSSNCLGFKFNEKKKEIYSDITETRWLPKEGQKILPRFSFNPFLYFHEFAIPINFQTQLYNLIGAIRDWDLNIKKRIKNYYP